MIYGAVVKQYESNQKYMPSSIDESGIILEFLEKDINNTVNDIL